MAQQTQTCKNYSAEVAFLQENVYNNMDTNINEGDTDL